MKSLSFFSGAGGLLIGCERAGFETVAACEIPSNVRIPHGSKSKARDTLLINRPDLFIYEGIESYDFSHSDIDLIEGGPPCQSFSTAGKRKGITDSRGMLLLKYIQIIMKVKPKTFILENVIGLTTIEDERVYNEIVDVLSRFGYKIRCNKVDAQNYGLAQRRKRVLIVGSLNRMPEEMKPFGFSVDLNILSLARSFEYLNASPSVWKAIANGKARRLSFSDVCPTLTTCLTAKRHGLTFIHPTEDRILSIEECKILQGFSDSWKLAGSTRDKYRQLGNAVPVPVAYEAARTARESLL